MRSPTAALLLALTLSPATSAHAEPITIDQNAWLNYSVIVSSNSSASDISINQSGAINAVSSVQRSGSANANLQVHQTGYGNTTAAYQSGWYTFAGVTQEAQRDHDGDRHQKTGYSMRKTDEGYLSYFMTGGFSLVTLTDENHTWVSRFGRAR